MKKILIITILSLLSCSLFAYPMLSWGAKANAAVPFLVDGNPPTDGVEWANFGLFVDGLYAFNNGFTVGLEGSLNGSLMAPTSLNGDGETTLTWGLTPMVGYTYLNYVFFQAFFQPIIFTTNAGVNFLDTKNSIQYKTGIQTYIGFAGRSLFGAGSVSLGVGASSYWGHQEWGKGTPSSFKTLQKFNVSLSLRYTELLASNKKNK